jgi:DNA-binding CsgD family transcriptional regulator/catechol 2,3-dioxygenase-like lactoylglutathione lyase family enzyme
MSLERSRGRPPHADLLTPSEWRVVEGVRHGLTNPAIALRLGIGVDAVKFHVGNALQKLGFSGRKELRSWNGVRRDSHLKQRTLDMENGVALGPIGQISRTVLDISAARRWYEDVLGLPHLYSFGNLAFFDCGGVRLFLSEGEAKGGDSILYFKVDDVRSAHAALSERGVEFTNAPHMIHRHADGTEEWLAVFNDPDGRPLAIISRVTA